MIITEAELREAWKNGRGSLPQFPHGTRFTPAARDFIASLGAAGGDSPGGSLDVAGDGSMELRAPDGRRLILTSSDLDDILQAKPQSIVVHPEVTITDAARERLRNAGVRVTQSVEASAGSATEASAPAPALASAGGGDEELFVTAKRAIMARLDGRADESVVDAVLRRVLASLPPANG